jgi:uncharacterized protein (TIGR03790 family)
MSKRLTVFLIASLFLIQGCNARVTGGPTDVLVVRNADSPVSTRIAAYYTTKRKIAPKFQVVIATNDSSISADNERISPDDYKEHIQKPIQDYLSSHKLTNQIKYIVLTKGIPLRLSSDPTGGSSGGQSVDSMLATMGIVDPLDLKIGEHGTPVINRYWRSNKPFSHAEFGGYLVTRLDGYTEADAKNLVDRALAPASVERIVLLDVCPGKGLGDATKQPKCFINPDGTRVYNPEVGYSDFNADMTRLSQILSNRPKLKIILDRTDDFVSSPKPLTAYVSWGSNDSKFTPEIYHSLKFAPRSLAETAVSSSGRTLLKTEGGQSLIADLISQGVAGAKGYVTEPYLFAMASPSVFLELYMSGRNLAESFYAGSRIIGWKDIVLGDPLCRLPVK